MRIVPALTLLVVAWLTVAPTQLGGSNGYTIINGASMEPGMRKGDLAIVRQRSSYDVGDVVTYRDPLVGPTIHRIVDVDGDRFVLQGDNNGWLDPYRPTSDEIVGGLWLHVPGAGTYASYLRSPLVFAGVAAGIFVLIGVNVTRRNAGKRGTRMDTGSSSRPSAPSSGRHGGSGLQDALALVSVVLIGSLVLAYVAFSTPSTRRVARSVQYEQTGAFRYSADAPPGVYDTGSAVTGNPVFRSVTDSMAVEFDYTISSASPLNVTGSYNVNALISDSSGWSRTLPIVAETPFTGSSFSAEFPLDLGEAQSLVDRASAATGLTQRQYTIDIVVDVAIDGAVHGLALTDSLESRLTMNVTEAMATLNGASLTDGAVVHAASGSLPSTETTGNSLSILFLSPSVGVSRLAAIGGIAGALIAAGALGMAMRRARELGELERVMARHGHRIVTVTETPLREIAPLFDVATFEDLVRVADSSGRPILHETHRSEHVFLVHDGGGMFQFRLSAGGPSRSIEPRRIASSSHGVPRVQAVTTIAAVSESQGKRPRLERVRLR